ncbi:MAG TPA: phosphate starvation-inducible protein PhoH [Deltaproteobacteria bacterium]|nr:MAG: phosphate starvation-inducible protein PhoH [Deltaproteobacteria bacterium GWA2_55_82]OGQ61978.1 MAG: phosphate starvation-inducible protein PhoH [Deltaproteobacteria bacterium RIFCSPLOWO2_02_FULL_55_12]OIJ74673.1 MAG: phosphate starvation-inducible protein PhoH [Deltaproteobacteria bacterium GWC2_55_46]HBG46383.1 phosphate starvation-inducible protein PhoH [Deltaproteobacteria bacterium]HCY10594.1 phosphate starvation-inducible protein PhoH [Deltaproteobacteria bacterium]
MAIEKNGTIKKQVTLGDNNLAVRLFGEGGENLKRFEKKLGVEINTRGALVTINGTPEKALLAEKLILGVYDLLEKGYPLYPHDLDYAVRMMINNSEVKLSDVFMDTVYISYRKKVIAPKSVAQKRYIDAIRGHDIVFGIGPAGTGKTYLAMAMAVAALMSKEVDRIILTRPAVEAGEKLGFLPGDLAAKVDPYLRPLYDALHDMIDFDRAQKFLERGAIEVAPLAFMRGRTLNDSFIILDEAQNTTIEQMKMFLTRLGFGSKAVITGDITQIDLPLAKPSGLVEAQKILEDVEGIDFIMFSETDVVRHPLVQKVVKAFDRIEQKRKSAVEEP